jgi:hypothetical protein
MARYAVRKPWKVVATIDEPGPTVAGVGDEDPAVEPAQVQCRGQARRSCSDDEAVDLGPRSMAV